MHLSVIDFCSYHESVTAALNAVNAGETLAKQKSILLKPNLTNASPHPVTTPAACCEAVIEYIRSCSAAEIIIAEPLASLDYAAIIDPHTLEDVREIGGAAAAAVAVWSGETRLIDNAIVTVED